MRGAEELVQLVARRAQLLSALEGGPRLKSDVVAALDVSRSTVDRSVRELEAEGLVERRSDGIGLTLPGRLVFEEFRDLTERCDGIAAAEGVLRVLDADADVDPALLADPTVVTAERTSPYRPARRFMEVLAAADGAKVLSTAISPRYVETVRRLIVDEGLEYRVGATPTIVERMVTEYRESLEASLATGRLTLRELDDDPSFTLAVVDGSGGPSVDVLVYDDEGVRGYVGNDAPEAVEWGEAVFRRYWTDATPISAPRSED